MGSASVKLLFFQKNPSVFIVKVEIGLTFRMAQTVRPKAWPSPGKCRSSTQYATEVPASLELHSQGLK